MYFRFLHPAAGVWKIRVRLEDRADLPVPYLASGDRAGLGGYVFLEPSPYNTVTSPGDTREGITVTAYQHRDNSLYLNASRDLPRMEGRQAGGSRRWDQGADSDRRIWGTGREQSCHSADGGRGSTAF